MPLGKAKLGWQNLLEHYGMVQPYTSHGMVQPGTSGLGALCYCLSATLYGTNIKAEAQLLLSAEESGVLAGCF